jgi:Ulp1 family protease
LRSIVITKGDLTRIQTGEYLNDTVIDWWLNVIFLRQTRGDADRARLHMFSSFLYKKMTLACRAVKRHGGIANDVLEDAKQREAYASVQRWTRGVDIFSKEWSFVPINYGLHWSLAIVVNAVELSKALRTFDTSLRRLTKSGAPQSAALAASDGASFGWEGKGEGSGANEVSGRVSDGDGKGEGSVGVVDGDGDEDEDEDEEEASITAAIRAVQHQRDTSSSFVAGDNSGIGPARDESEVEEVSDSMQQRKRAKIGEPVLPSSSPPSSSSSSSSSSAPAAVAAACSLTDDGEAQEDKSATVVDARTGVIAHANGVCLSQAQFDELLAAAAPRSNKPTCAILFLDSLGCHAPTRAVAPLLRSYLFREWLSRQNNDSPVGGLECALSFSQRSALLERLVPLARPTVPQQDNSVDCGVYVLKYAEAVILHSQEDMLVSKRAVPTPRSWRLKASMVTNDFIRSSLSPANSKSLMMSWFDNYDADLLRYFMAVVCKMCESADPKFLAAISVPHGPEGHDEGDSRFERAGDDAIMKMDAIDSCEKHFADKAKRIKRLFDLEESRKGKSDAVSVNSDES